MWAAELLADELWAILKTADGESLFFGDRAPAQQRSLLRYASLAGQKITTEKDSKTAQMFELARKKFQVMESLVKMFLAWTKRKSSESQAATSAFCMSWDGMMAFAAFTDEIVPAVTLECPFIDDLHYQVLASGDLGKLGKALAQATGISVQIKYIGQAITKCLASSRSMLGITFVQFSHVSHYNNCLLLFVNAHILNREVTPRLCVFHRANTEQDAACECRVLLRGQSGFGVVFCCEFAGKSCQALRR